MSKALQVVTNLRAEQGDLSNLQQNTLEKEEHWERQQEELKT